MLRRVSVACIIWHFALPIQVGSCLCIPPVLPLTGWNPSDARGWPGTSDAVANVRTDVPHPVDGPDVQPSAEAGVAYEQRGRPSAQKSIVCATPAGGYVT